MNIAYSVHKNSNAVFMKYDRAANVRRREAQPLHTQRDLERPPVINKE